MQLGARVADLEVDLDVADQVALAAYGRVPDAGVDPLPVVEHAEQVDELRLADSVHRLFVLLVLLKKSPPKPKKMAFRAMNFLWGAVILFGASFGLYGQDTVIDAEGAKADAAKAKSNAAARASG